MVKAKNQEFVFDEPEKKKKPKPPQTKALQEKRLGKNILFVIPIFISLGVASHFYLAPDSFYQRLISMLIFAIWSAGGLVGGIYLSLLIRRGNKL